MKKVSLIILVSLCIGMFFVACKDKKEVVKIGIIVPLTGEVATYGQDLKKGMDIAFEEENTFKPIYQDSKAHAATGLSAMKHLQDIEKVKFFLGDATTTVSLVISEEAQKNKNILLVPIASGNDIKKKGDFIFMNCPRNEKQSIAAAKYVVDNIGAKKVGIIYQQISYGVELSNKFSEELGKYNISPVFNESFQDAKTGLKNIILKAKMVKPDIIFIPTEYESAALILKQCREQGLICDFIGTDGAYSEKLIELAGDAADGFYFTMFPISTKTDYYKSFEEKFKTKYNSQPNVFSCYGYESAKNLIYAIKQVGSSTDMVKDFFYNNEFDSSTGKLRFDETGEVVRDFGIIKVQNREFVFQE